MVKPNGAKLWRLTYRFSGKQKLLALGIYPTFTLAEARSGRESARNLLATNVDPSVRRKFEKQSLTVTFRLIAKELLDKMEREGRAPQTLTKTRWLLDFAFPAIGDRPAAKIAAPELLAVSQKIEARVVR